MNKALLLLLALFLIVPGVTASLSVVGVYDEYAKISTNLTVVVYVANYTAIQSNETTECNIDFYNISGERIVIGGAMSYDAIGQAFYYNLTEDQLGNLGVYSYVVRCNATVEVGMFGTDVTVTKEGGPWEYPSMPINMIILLPMLLSVVALVGAATLGEEHIGFRIFLYLFSFLPFLTSMHMGLVSIVKFYDWPIMENIIGDTTYWFSLILFAVISYFVIYMIWKIFKGAKEDRERGLEY